jgi:MFS transporter, DHA1 family, tetracycline resistance protein
MKRQPSIGIIFLTVFLDLVGFGIVLPLLPVFSEEMGASGFLIGVIMASFSLMQFIFAPWWGRLSDRIGRRPVLLVSLAFSALSYAIFAIGSGMTGEAGLWVLLGSRVAAGICGANISVAQAYIADITPPENRSKRMGLIGMAFGLGFIFGPVLGGVSLKWFGVTGPGWVATAFCAVNFLLALVILPESRKPNGEHAPQRPRFAQWMHTLSQPKVGLLIWLFFLATFAFTCFETTLGLLVAKNFGLHPKQDADKISYLFTYCGLIGALVQGGAVGRLVKKLGEPGLIALSLGLTAASLALMPFMGGWPALLAVLAVLSIGSQLARPPIFGMISNLTPPNEQGATLGVAQSIGSLARIAGPIFAGSLFKVSPAIPYVACAAVAALAGVIAWQRLHHVPRQSPASQPAEAA